MMNQVTELDVLNRIVPELERDGYEVYIEPRKPLIPVFLGDFRPDAIALKDGRKLVIEVMRKSPRSSQKLDRITALFKDEVEWELKVVWVEPTSDPFVHQAQSVEIIENRIAQVEQIVEAGHNDAAMLLAWATFEAIAFSILSNSSEYVRSPSVLVEKLARGGNLTPVEADALRSVAKKRNVLIHGDLSINITQSEIRDFVATLRELLSQSVDK